MENYWDLLARQFHHQQPPLRPCAEDAAIISGILRDGRLEDSAGQTDILLLGVTPEIAALPLPSKSSLLAIEQSQAMIDLIWPGDISNRRKAVRGNWFEIDFKPCTYDFVIGDGFTTGLAYPDQYRNIAARISEWLRPEGLLISRLFVRSAPQETHERIFVDLQARRIPRFDTLKWRLGMACQTDVKAGVALGDIYHAWITLEKSWPSLAQESGWPESTVQTINLYSGRKNRYHFPTIEEITAEFSGSLELVSTTIPRYHFGECCPTLVFRRRHRITA